MAYSIQSLKSPQNSPQAKEKVNCEIAKDYLVEELKRESSGNRFILIGIDLKIGMYKSEKNDEQEKLKQENLSIKVKSINK